MMERQKQLVRLLLAKTKRGELAWQEGIRQDSFQVSFKDNSVLIRDVANKDDNEIRDYEIQLINGEGKTVDSFTDVDLTESETARPTTKWFPPMRDLHDLARRTALGSEKILGEILKDLGDEDVPF
jgi:hypothetical protein